MCFHVFCSLNKVEDCLIANTLGPLALAVCRQAGRRLVMNAGQAQPQLRAGFKRAEGLLEQLYLLVGWLVGWVSNLEREREGVEKKNGFAIQTGEL